MGMAGDKEMRTDEMIIRALKAAVNDKGYELRAITQCKSCRYWFSAHGKYGVCEYFRQKEGMPIGMDAEDFCSKGERK